MYFIQGQRHKQRLIGRRIRCSHKFLQEKKYLHPFTTSLYNRIDGSDGKESTCNAGDRASITGLGRCPRGGHGNPLQYSSLENPMDRGAWRATAHGVAKSWT